MAKTGAQYLKDEATSEVEYNLFKNQWQLVSEYVHQRRADFTGNRTPGAFISSHLWADAPVHMAETSASAFLGYIWSAGVKSFKLVGDKNIFGKDKEMQDFWAEVSENLQKEMDDNEAGLAVALDESMLDLITLGTDCVFIEERNIDKPDQGCLSYEPWSIQQFKLKENASGRAAKFYRRREYTVEQHVEKYGLKNVSAKVQQLYERRQMEEKVRVLHVIEPRSDLDRMQGSLAAKDMPWSSVHIEIDSKKIVKNSGYQELPAACARLAKRLNESYGRGRAMNGLPSIMLLNQVCEDFSLALEKKLDPPMYQLHDAVSGNGYIDTSAGSITILRLDKTMPNVPPTGKLFDIQDTSQIEYFVDKLTDNISNHFMIDRLINMNNDVEMTKGEAFLRNGIRQSTLRSIVSRILLEKFDVIINTSFMISLRRNKFGYMPGDPEARAKEQAGEDVKYLPDAFIKAMESGKDLFNIEYLTPAARDMLAEEGQGMVDTLAIAKEMAEVDETIPHRIDAQWTLNRIAEIKGADRRMFRKEADAEARIAKVQEAQQQAQQATVLQQMGGLAKDAAIAQNTTQGKR